MDWYETEVRELEDRRAIEPWPPHPAVFYGSSSIRLWNTLARDLDRPCIVNLGFGGSTLEACVWFFERLVTRARPASLVVYAGDNDLGDGRTPREVADRFEALAAKVDRDLKTAPFGFISIKPSPARAALLARIVETNETIRCQIARHPSAFYIDVFTPMLGQDGRPRADFFLEDGLHLSRRGYQLWTRVLRRFRDQIFTADCADGHTSVLGSTSDGP